jgi:hypothetical protein
MAITTASILDLIPLNGGVSDTVIQSYIDIVTQEADLLLNNIFASPLSVVTEANKINYSTQNSSGSNFIFVNAWQESGLTIKRTNIDNQNVASLTETPLVEGKDYVFWFGFGGDRIVGKTLPVTKIKLFDRLHPNEILRVYGTYGWQAGYPADVELALTNTIVDLATHATNQANNGGDTGLMRIESMTVEIEQSEAMTKQLRKEARNFLENESFKAIIAKYTLALKPNVYIV